MNAALLTVLCTLLPGQTAASDAELIDVRSGETVSIPQFVTATAQQDVIFLGEEHDNDAGHALQLAIIEALHAQRDDLVISMEMFERDVQGVLDDYLHGRIEEAEFLEHSRPWKNYAEHYRPIIEFARKHRLDVIAGNVPRRLARQVSRGETPISADRQFLPRLTTAPGDAYRERFLKVMSGHGGTDAEDAMDRYYRSQCLKDDAMAEAIADYLAAHPHRKPLIVHLCGRFHSDYGQGTVQRLLQRRPLTRLRVVSMEVRPEESDGNDEEKSSPQTDNPPLTALPSSDYRALVPANRGSSDEP